MKKKLFTYFILLLNIVISGSCYSQWQHDKDFDFKINVPESWTTNSYMDGTDKVYDFYSPDENAAIQLRAFDAGPGITTDVIVQVYEESMLPAGTQKESLTDHVSKQGIAGKQGIYSFDYNGNDVAMGVFFAVKNKKGYVISAMIPKSLLESKSAEVKRITGSFTLTNAGPSPVSGLLGGTSGNANLVSKFKINSIQLCDKIDQHNNAVNTTNNFKPHTPEIFAVVSYSGETAKDLIVTWIYDDWNRTISSDKFNFLGSKGGTGVVSLTKPNAGWPEGNYTVKFEMDNNIIKTVKFKVEENNIIHGSGGASNSSVQAGKYSLESRSDGKSLVNFHYIFIRDDGYFDEKYQPKNSGNYVGGGQGTWKKTSGGLTFNYDDGTVINYSVEGDRLIRKSHDGTIFTFRKAE